MCFYMIVFTWGNSIIGKKLTCVSWEMRKGEVSKSRRKIKRGIGKKSLSMYSKI